MKRTGFSSFAYIFHRLKKGERIGLLWQMIQHPGAVWHHNRHCFHCFCLIVQCYIFCVFLSFEYMTAGMTEAVCFSFWKVIPGRFCIQIRQSSLVSILYCFMYLNEIMTKNFSTVATRKLSDVICFLFFFQICKCVSSKLAATKNNNFHFSQYLNTELCNISIYSENYSSQHWALSYLPTKKKILLMLSCWIASVCECVHMCKHLSFWYDWCTSLKQPHQKNDNTCVLHKVGNLLWWCKSMKNVSPLHKIPMATKKVYFNPYHYIFLTLSITFHWETLVT